MNERENDSPEIENDAVERENIQNEIISQTGGLIVRGHGITLQCLTIAGQIEGHTSLSSPIKSTKYEQIIPQLVEVEQSDDIDGLILLLNTVGGDVEAGLAIAEMIAGMKKPSVSLVLGGGHSIGIPLAVSADRSFIVKSATMTVHPVRMTGLVIGVPQSFSYFRKMQQRINDFIIEHSGISEKDLTRLMLETDDMAGDVGSIINGVEAKSIGLIDEIGGLADAVSTLKTLAGRK